MPTVKCPHCTHELEFYVGPANNALMIRPTSYDSLISDVDGQIHQTDLRAVLAFLRHVGPGRYASSLLYKRYGLWRLENEAPALSHGNFGRAVSVLGIERTRSAKQRDYVIPENINTMEAVAPYIDSRRAQRAGMEAAIAAHTGKDKSPAVDPLAEAKARAAEENVARRAEIEGKPADNGFAVRKQVVGDLTGLPFEVEQP